MNTRESFPMVFGYAKPDFKPVQATFIKNFLHRKDLGAACCIYYQGEKVVDLWGGMRNIAIGKSSKEGWKTCMLVLGT